MISMDGKGRWIDHVFIERVWRSLKYADVYLKADAPVEVAQRGIAEYFRFYNQERRHQAPDRQTPDAV